MAKGVAIIALSFLTVLFYGCRRFDGGNDTDVATDGEIGLSLVSYSAGTSGGLDAVIDEWGTVLGDFRLLIYSGETLIKKWNRYSDLIGNGKVRSGTHRVVAFYGDSTKVGFAKPYYYGESPVVIKAGQVTPVTVTAKLRNVRISVVADDEFKAACSDYSVLLYTSEQRLTFTSDEERSAFAPPADIRFRISFTKADGEQKIYIPPTVKDVAPGDHITLRLRNEDGSLALDITKDLSTEDKELLFEIPRFMLPKPVPEFTASGFDANKAVTYTEGFSQNARVGIFAPGQIRECIVEVQSPTLLSRGWPASFDLLTIDAHTRSIVERDSLKWDDMTDNITGTVDFGATLGLLGSGEHAFSFTVTDGVGQTVSSDLYKAHTRGAVFEWMPFDGAAWATHIDAGANITDANPSKFTLQLYRNGQWTDMSDSRTLSDSGDKLELKSWGLVPETAYRVRMAYNGNIFSEPADLVTEKAAQVPNAGFETWSEYMCYKKTQWVFIGTMGIEIYEIYPYDMNDASSKFWDTRNWLTTSDHNGASAYYNQYSGTRQAAGVSGNAAEISTVNWGSGSTFVEGSGYITKNITPGMLFIGEYDTDNRRENFGRSFPSRPEGVRFDYKFAQIDGESFDAYAIVEHRAADGTVTELGRARVDAETAKTAVGDFKNITLKFDYTNKTVKATHITIAFVSSTADSPAVNKVKGSAGADKGYHDSKYIGNVLTVDNVELIYTEIKN